jgi:hypothetical protein
MTQTIKQRVTLAHVARELRAVREILRLPTTDSTPPVTPPPATTSGAALARVRFFLRSARHSVTRAIYFFTRDASSSDIERRRDVS